MAELTAGAPADGGAQAPGYRRLPLTEVGSPRPRRLRHAVAAALVAGYLLAAVVVILAQHAVAVPQWLALQLNAGVVSVLTGVASGWTPLAIAGATLVIAAVVAHVASLVAMARAATLPGRLRIAVRFYVAGGIALAFGAGLGAVLASHAAESDAWERAVVLTHAHLNVLGWLGLSVIGTQFMLWPAVLRTRMAEDAPAVARRVLVGASVGLAIAVTALLLSPEVGATGFQPSGEETLAASPLCSTAPP